jgi:hypothetical protein
MQALYLIYDESLHAESTTVVERDLVVPRYTRIDHVIGARMADELRALRSRRGRGLRGFVVPVTSSI